MKLLDLSGRRFGRLLVLGRSENKGRFTAWKCLCDCGNTAILAKTNLNGRVRSCGCLRRQISRERCLKHGHKGTSEYNIWVEMRHRCRNKKHKQYLDYGGRGIFVCDRWDNSFLNFLADMGPRPEGKSLDRVNNDGPYSPENCRWATPLEQAHNQRPRRIRTEVLCEKSVA